MAICGIPVMLQKPIFKILFIFIAGIVITAGVLVYTNKYLTLPQTMPTAKDKITVPTPISAPPTSTQETVCIYKDGSCCQKEGVCNIVMVDCKNGFRADIKGCNEKCEAIFECVPDFSDWKTYRNEEYGFELKYQNQWTFYEHSVGIDIGVRFESSKTIQEGCDINERGNVGDNPFLCPGNAFDINVDSGLTRDKYIENFKYSKFIVSQTEDVIISGNRFTKITFANFGPQYIRPVAK